jgi:hypothetical protein
MEEQALIDPDHAYKLSIVPSSDVLYRRPNDDQAASARADRQQR